MVGSSVLYVVSTVFRLTATLLWLGISMSALLIMCVPIRILTPICRKLGLSMHLYPADIIQRYWSASCLWFAGIQVIVEGAENVPLNSSSVIFLNHNSNIDPWVSMGYCPIAPKFLYKRELIWFVPPVGVLAYCLGHIPINRYNRTSAIASMNDASSRITDQARSVLIYPEGQRASDGKLQEFKKGAFHMAKDSKTPMLAGVMTGSFDIWKTNSFYPGSGIIHLRWLKPVPVNEESVDELSSKMHKIFSEELEKINALNRVEGRTTSFAKPNTQQDLFNLARSIGLLSVVAGVIYSLFF